MFSQGKKVFLLSTTILLLGLAGPVFVANRPTAAAQATAIARIEHIIVGGVERMEAEVSEGWVNRASNREVLAAKAGMPLYPNDLVATGNNVKIILRGLNVPNEHDAKITLKPGCQLKIIGDRSYFLVLGRAWFGVKGLFTVRTIYWILGARGTEFEVEADKLSNTTLQVLEGAVNASETEENRARSMRRIGRAPLDVKALEEIHLTGSDIQRKDIKPLTEEQVRSMLDSTNEAFLASQPSSTARRVFPHFDSLVKRGRAFESARFNAIWHQQPAAFDTLGNIYSDWGEGAQALESYKKELSFNLLVQDDVAFLTNLGESFRMIGELDKAEKCIKDALKKNQTWAPALNAMGNIHIAKAELARANKDLASAKLLLQNATEAYERSFLSVASRQEVNLDRRFALELAIFQKSPTSRSHLGAAEFGVWDPPRRLRRTIDMSVELQDQARGVAKANIGDAKSGLAYVAEKEQDIDAAIRFAEEARRAYLEAKSFYPQYSYIDRGLSWATRTISDLVSEKKRAQPQPQPQPRTETAEPASGVTKLNMPIEIAPRGNEGLITASALAAAVSYLQDRDVETCEMLALLSRTRDCCDRRNTRYCSYFGNSDVVYAAQRFRSVFDIDAEVTRMVSYNHIVASIGQDSPLVVLDTERHSLVITGYSSSGKVVVLDPTDGKEHLITHSSLLKRQPRIVRFSSRRPVPYRPIIQDASEIIEKLLGEDFAAVAERLRVFPGTLRYQYESIVKQSGPLVRRRVPQVRQSGLGLEVSIRCTFQKSTVTFVLNFDQSGSPVRLLMLPESKATN